MKETLRARAKEIVAVLYNSATYTGDCWELSMELSQIQQRLGAMGIDKSHAQAEAEDQDED